ncbi:MAG TPA: PaaI family thioesterase [Marinagarivorans sp.]
MRLLAYLPDLTMLTILADRLITCYFPSKIRERIAPPELGEELIPPGVQSSVFNGFVTSSNNENGLKLKIHHDKKGGVSCRWTVARAFEGYPQTLHGGVSFAILDELLAYSVFDRYRTFAVTLSSKTQWLGRIKVDSDITAKAVVTRKFWRFVRVEGMIFNNKGRVVVKMHGTFYMPTKSEFKKLIDLSIMPSESLPYCGTD